jgi:hypothetical protein
MLYTFIKSSPGWKLNLGQVGLTQHHPKLLFYSQVVYHALDLTAIGLGYSQIVLKQNKFCAANFMLLLNNHAKEVVVVHSQIRIKLFSAIHFISAVCLLCLNL